MSWKATAFVKELTEGLSITDKFVLLILSDYHRTDGKNEWPSTETLGPLCLMTERGVRQVLNRLDDNGFIVREQGGGRGNKTVYGIVGLDVPGKPGVAKKREQDSGNDGSLNTETGNETGNGCAENRAQPCAKQGTAVPRNKVLQDLPVIEPNGDTSPEIIPPNLHGTQAAAKLIQQVQESRYELAGSHAVIRAIALTFEALVNGGKSPPAAYEFLVAVTFDAIERGERIDKFFFEDSKWRGGNGQRQNSTSGRAAGTGGTRAQTRSERSIDSLRRAAERHATGGDAHHPNQRKGGA